MDEPDAEEEPEEEKPEANLNEEEMAEPSIICDGSEDGKPIAAHTVGALGSDEPLTWTCRGQASCYSLFGRLGQGLGGFTVNANRGEAAGVGEGATLLQAKAYCGGWVHFLKAMGAPALTVSKSHSANFLPTRPHFFAPSLRTRKRRSRSGLTDKRANKNTKKYDKKRKTIERQIRAREEK